MNRYQTIYLIFILLSGSVNSWGQGDISRSIPSISIDETLQWHPVETIEVGPGEFIQNISFSGSGMADATGRLPIYFHKSAIQDLDLAIQEVTISSVVYQALTPLEILAIEDVQMIPVVIQPTATIVWQRKKPFVEITFLPFRRDPLNGLIEKVVSFKLSCSFNDNQSTPSPQSVTSYTEHSVLANGSWYKFATSSNGVHMLSYDDLLNAGITPSSIDPRTIRIHGNGGGMLPEANIDPRVDDLQELSIQVVGEEDGLFNEGDYILFYGESQNVWHYNPENGLFKHQKNIYADYAYYFLTFGGVNGKRLTQEASTAQPATHTINRFNDYASYEKDDINLIKSGRQWFDVEYFDVTTTRNYPFAFPNLDQSSLVYISTYVAARSTGGSSTFNVSVNSQSLCNISIPKVSGNFLATYAREKVEECSVYISSSSIDVKLTYNKPNISAVGYLNYLEVNVMRNLAMSGGQMSFRSIESAGSGQISEFHLSTQGQSVTIWDVTNPDHVKNIQSSVNGNTSSFRVPTDTLREFIGFDGSSYMKPEYIGSVANQDLHGVGNYDYVIVSYPAFVSQAERLAQFHRDKNGMDVLITTPQKIFNEFSSGAQDLSAIRDFIRMMYDRAPAGDEIKYLLLFGDASYDYKNRLENNTNFVLSYESPRITRSGRFLCDR